MITMTLAEVAAVTGGRLHRATGDEQVTSVEFDSRKAAPGVLFLALPGERVDGHSFAAAAVAAGAAGVLAAREVDAPSVVVPPAAGAAGTYLAENDPDGAGAAVLAALAKLARHSVDSLTDDSLEGLAVVGVTGSSGKTSTKDLLAAVLAPLGPTVAPPGSFNNELGHPWTALRADAGTRHLVLELSARGPGHIAALCRIAPPRIGVVLNVGRAHLGEFGSPEAIAQAKGELVEALPAGGVAVLNADDPAVAAMATRTAARVVPVGRGADALVRAVDVTSDAGRARFRLVTPAGEADVALRLVGAHHVGNALSAAAVALELGATPAGVAESLSAAAPASRWRMEVADRADGVTVVNDAYNANPESMRAALEALADLGRDRRTWAVLGRMAELGDTEAAAHAEVAGAAAALGVGTLVAVGEPGYGPAARHVTDPAAALALLRAEVSPGDVVLVKASRAVGLDRVADALLNDTPRDDRQENELVSR
ncbi:MAG: UDP-N-acetylmuramoyl-tripeptide--D-alanyl-D-alanine ligase [Pseudonocardia sp.]|uniref:UDP-N-acetylmuramoyl-tripeptide--D-alanyl-D- alanine ligase n=1 Tax=unclassified Pseudonocardia TaxID=2619320 RepID=UPI00086D9F1A|nr:MULTISPECIES: UDP-N-acetylmuramoyl-tripeptide--D-alanyl-D-alanine ligase [unclassified Pseudonocardia]MBN9107775.1 UDP-N-acetylmuramoyl-tripeptide--D-alanyl-D-alanine ligase [Pseudonocardia sp.]ODV07520.1 MAG: UDP-N-acetylmuramoyl-tripeptide--D-alanyl-D-alanine ligase [Pseudonocardia sp. SCN 73-27]